MSVFLYNSRNFYQKNIYDFLFYHLLGEGLEALAAPGHCDDRPPPLRQQAGGGLPDSGGGSSDDDAAEVAHSSTVISPGTHRRARPGILAG